MNRIIIPLLALAVSTLVACTPAQIQDAIDLDAQRRAVVDVTTTLPPPDVAPVDPCTQPIPVDDSYAGKMGAYTVIGEGVFLNLSYAPDCPTIPTPDELLPDSARRSG